MTGDSKIIAYTMFKVKHDLCPQNVGIGYTCTHNLRNANLDIPRFNTVTYSKHSLGYLGP